MKKKSNRPKKVEIYRQVYAYLSETYKWKRRSTFSDLEEANERHDIPIQGNYFQSANHIQLQNLASVELFAGINKKWNQVGKDWKK